MSRFSIIFIFFLVSILACHDDEDLMVGSMEYCEKEQFENELNEYIQDENLLLQTIQDSLNTCLLFDSGDTIKICNELILSNIFDKEANAQFLQLQDSTHYVIDRPDYSPILKVELDPFKRNPLCAKASVSSQSKLKVKVNLYNKSNASIDMTADYECDQIDEIPILGLFQDHKNMIEVIYSTSNNNLIRIDTFYIQTPKLEIDPFIEVIEKQESKMANGNFHLISSGSYIPDVPYAIDHNGEIRWILDYSNDEVFSNFNYDVGIEFLENGNLYFGEISTNKIYEVNWFGEVLSSWAIPGFGFHHTVFEKPNGNFLATVNKWGATHLDGNTSVEDHVIEIDRTTGQIIKEWDFRDLLDENRDELGIFYYGNSTDWLHVNSVWYDESDHTFVISGRHQGVVKVDYDDQVKWIFSNHLGWGQNRKGQDCNEFLLTPTNQFGEPYSKEVMNGWENIDEFEWSWFQHSAMIMPNGNLFLFDNGLDRNFETSSDYSRAVEYKINESNMTVEQVWTYGKERGLECYGNIISDVDYYADNHSVLFAPGNNIFNGSTQVGGRIVEVDYSSKEVLFDIIIVELGLTFHRVERFDF